MCISRHSAQSGTKGSVGSCKTCGLRTPLISQFGSPPRIVEILVNDGDFVKKGDILAIFENRKKLIADLERNKNLIKTINDEISLKKDQIQMYELALSKNAYSFVELSQRKDELLKLQKQKINHDMSDVD